MSFEPEHDSPLVTLKPPGPASLAWLQRAAQVGAPMGPPRRPGPPHGIVYARARGLNVWDVDGNRFVDLAGGFGALLLGHSHPEVSAALSRQADTLVQALGDVYPSDLKIQLCERLAALYPEPNARVILGQSGADAVTAAVKTACLATGKPGIIAFGGAYHGLSYAPLAACGLRPSYRDPFGEQLNPHVRFLPYPSNEEELEAVLVQVEQALGTGTIGCALVEPVLGRGGCIVPPPGFLPRLRRLLDQASALLIADEVWTGLGRAGNWLVSTSNGVIPDLICLGKGLGGGIPISACLGRDSIMRSWQRDEEVVHTSTFAGAPPACACALATLDVLTRDNLVDHAAHMGVVWRKDLSERLSGIASVRGAGLMVGIDMGAIPGRAVQVMGALLSQGYLVSTGGGRREVVVLTPPLATPWPVLSQFSSVLAQAIRETTP